MQNNVETKGKSTVYNIRFANLTDLHDYLKSDPVVNRRLFARQASVKNDFEFSGEDLDTSIGYCIGGYRKGFDNFLMSNTKLKETTHDLTDNRTLIRTLYGGIPQPALVAAGVPDCMMRYERDSKSSVRNIYFNLAYPAYTTTSRIVNRGLATLYIIQALEAKGEMVNFKAFELSKCYDEIVNIELNLKKPGDLFLDVEKCYYPIKAKEFLRRVLFRVLESSDVQEYYWGDGYGTAMSEEEIRDFYNVRKQDLVISYPSEMGIEGTDIYDDTVTLIEKLGLEKDFDIPKIRRLQEREKGIIRR